MAIIIWIQKKSEAKHAKAYPLILAKRLKTKFLKSDFEKILSNYNLGLLKNTKIFRAGNVQTNILLQTEKGIFVFRFYKQNRSLHSVLFEVNLIRYLKARNYPCSAPIKNKQGKFIETYAKKPFVIFEFIEGCCLKNPTEEQRNQLIKKVAELQNLTKGYRPHYKKERWNYSVGLCGRLAEKEAEKIGTWNSEEKLRWINSELSKLFIPKSLPKGICHCDFHFSNVLFLNNKFNALIDFDDANYTYLVFDLVYLIEPFKSSFRWNNWKINRDSEDIFDFIETKRTVEEYSKYRSLNNNEKRHLFDVYKLSILIDCVWYFGRGNAEDFYEKRKIDYLNALGRDKFYDKVFKE